MLLAKHEPTNNTRSHGIISKLGFGTLTIVLNSIFTKVLLFVQKHKKFRNVFRILLLERWIECVEEWVTTFLPPTKMQCRYEENHKSNAYIKPLIL